MKFQLLIGSVNLAGERNNVTFRGDDSPMTYPEALVLKAIHGGDEHVHGLVDIGVTEDREPEAELERLAERYGKVVADIFPRVAGRVTLPERDENIPTRAEEAEAQRALAEVREKAAAKRAAKAATPALPGADDLPG